MTRERREKVDEVLLAAGVMIACAVVVWIIGCVSALQGT